MAVIAFQPGPGAVVLALWCDNTEEWDSFRMLCEQGTLSFDGQPVERRLDEASSRDALFIRFKLTGPYLPPPLVLIFEDWETAERIGEFGWYTFEGGLYRAEHRGEGRVYLDRVFATEPPEVYHGRVYAEPSVLDEEPGAQQLR